MCALTTTGFPAASAEAVSPPQAPNANGKFPAPNTTTGPSGRSTRRTSGFGNRWRFESAVSITASTHEPSRTNAANICNCPVVRARSPVNRASGNPVSARPRVIKSGPSATISSAIFSRSTANLSAGSRRQAANAFVAAARAEFTVAAEALWKATGSVSPVAGLLAVKVSAESATGFPAMRLRPCSFMNSSVVILPRWAQVWPPLARRKAEWVGGACGKSKPPAG